jgi:hypothetical protein
MTANDLMLFISNELYRLRDEGMYPKEHDVKDMPKYKIIQKGQRSLLLMHESIQDHFIEVRVINHGEPQL